MNSVWKQLYPDGHAFNVSDNTNRFSIHESIDEALNSFISQLASLVNGAIPDSLNLDEKEVDLLEYKYGVYFTEGLTLAQRIERIRLKMTYPNNVVNRSSAAWIEHVLRSFGFDVRVYENEGINPIIFFHAKNQYGNSLYNGSSYGGYKYNVIANSMFDGENYNFGVNLWATFFIRINTPIDSGRGGEFRELVLKLKPAHLCAILLSADDSIGDFNKDFNNDFLIE